jgi:hypothetical protein
METWGTDEVFCPTHARFAADLLGDCRTEFLRLTTALDFDVERPLRGRRRRTAPTAYTPGNRDKLIAAAAYAQWMSDHITQEAARCQREITAVCARYATNSDQVALLERQMVPFDGMGPSAQPPLRPGELESIETLPAPYLAQLDRAREWCGQALWAAGMSNTAAMETLCQHIGTLVSWLER